MAYKMYSAKEKRNYWVKQLKNGLYIDPKTNKTYPLTPFQKGKLSGKFEESRAQSERNAYIFALKNGDQDTMNNIKANQKARATKQKKYLASRKKVK